MVKQRYALFQTILLWLVSAGNLQGFSLVPSPRCRPTAVLFASRYGPPLDLERMNDKEDDDEQQQRKKNEFRKLLDKVMSVSKPEHIPSLLTKHTEVILKMQGEFAVETIQDILEEKRQQGGDAEVERVAEVIEMILSFAESFVNQSKNLDEGNKKLLGKIIHTMTEASGSEREREEKLDALLANERENFTRGFLRHLDGECERIASAPSISKEGTRLQEILKIIKTRIIEELGKDLGEGALILGQLVAYEDRHERIAVLDAGLTVRGLDFAVELGDLTAEALQGFQTVPDGADPTLVSRVEEIDELVKAFVEDNSTFQ